MMLLNVSKCEVAMAVDSLKPRQLQAIRLLATGTPLCKVAETLEVSTMTLHRWRRHPEFEAQIRSITQSGLQEIAKKMNAATITAIETLQETMCNLTQPAALQVKAALGVLHSMASVNNALEKALAHGAADFDAQNRFAAGPTFTYGSDGRPCELASGDLVPTDEPDAFIVE